MVRIGFPLRRLASAGDDHARTIPRTAALHLDGGGQVHQQIHDGQRTEFVRARAAEPAQPVALTRLAEVLKAICDDLEDGDGFSAMQIARNAGRAALAEAESAIRESKP